jgi:DNA-binding response OmpR family regulator
MASILVVDDEESIRNLITEALSDRHQCDRAQTVEEALDHLKAGSYDVVITDISMPGMSGLELLGHIRRTHPDTPVIVMSGIADEAHAMGLIKMGAFFYLMKPFMIADVEETIEQAIKYREEKRSRHASETQTEAPTTGMEAEEELMVLERQWAEAYRNRNVAALDRIWAEDFVLTSSYDSLKSKEQVLKMLMSDLSFEFFVTFDVHGNIFDETAVTTGRAIIKAEFQGQDISGEYKYTNTFAKRLGIWQAISSHLMRIEQL